MNGGAPREEGDDVAASSLDLDLIPAKEDFLHPVVESNVECLP